MSVKTQKVQDGMVNPNVIWKVVNGCRRVRREVDAGMALDVQLAVELQNELFLTQEKLREYGYCN